MDFFQVVKEFISNNMHHWAADLSLSILLSCLLWGAWKFIYARLNSFADKTATKWDDMVLHAFSAPINTVIWCWPLSVAGKVLLENKFDRSFNWIDVTESFFIAVIVAWVVLRLIKNIENHFLESNQKDKTTVHAVSKIARLLIITITILTTMQLLGLSLSGLLTFGGVGGLIVGMAAKDLLSNFFGGMMVYLDRPFKVGDWIRSPDREIEGTVEKIGWRMTVIRSFEKRPIYIPNSVFSNIVVENPSRMHNRQINENIGIRYVDALKMDAIIDDVRKMLQQHPDIDNRQTLIVNFTSFGPSSLDFFIYTFTKTVEWVRFHKVKQDVLLKVLAIIHQHGADVAFPTRTIQMDQFPPELADNSN